MLEHTCAKDVEHEMKSHVHLLIDVFTRAQNIACCIRIQSTVKLSGFRWLNMTAQDVWKGRGMMVITFIVLIAVGYTVVVTVANADMGLRGNIVSIENDGAALFQIQIDTDDRVFWMWGEPEFGVGDEVAITFYDNRPSSGGSPVQIEYIWDPTKVTCYNGRV